MLGKNLQIVNILAGLSFLVVSCGCSGSGGGSSGIKYDGNTEIVVITEDNANEVALSAYETSSGSESSGVGMVNRFMGRVASENPQPKNTSIASGLVNVAWSSISNFYNEENRSAARTAARKQSFSDSSKGSCGGSMTMSGWVEESNFSFSFNINFSNFCESDEVMNGTINASGQFDDLQGDSGNIDLTFSKINFRDSESSVTMSGIINASISPTHISMLINMTARDNLVQKTYKFVDFDISTDTSDEYYFCSISDCSLEISFSGVLYDYDYGRSEIATDTPFVFNSSEQYPSAGSLIVTGGAANDLAEGATKAKLTILDSSSYQVEADTDGNGVYDYFSEPTAW